MLMVGRGSDADRTKIPTVQSPPTPPYGTFSQPPPSAPLVYPPTVPHHQLPPQTTSGYHVIPVGYQSHPYPTLVTGIPMAMREPPLPFCGIGIGWGLLQRETRIGCMYSCYHPNISSIMAFGFEKPKLKYAGTKILGHG
ncbi:hypothetical protein OPV22_026950 [Ensete ventricosum]|uniref:G-box binding protein multifunctional mosaic region domain-containing protein n=1 Tax=Ensete ventricosum TaxID=4639 RepID=A0AAV8Q2H7_ENSVE|nr:hypothetical protein OPV22_026950 [Ensete ventricosum]